MRAQKRVMDLVCAVFLSIVLSPVILVVMLLILIKDGRPVFYPSERMRTVDQPFTLWKFRTMTVVENDDGVSGGDKSARITETGRFLRKHRLDELPQFWNVIRGDISFVGPRPPLRRYTEMFPEIYEEVLQVSPGLTGLATLVYHRTEERLLAKCKTPQETDAVYARRCVPAKARLDKIYARNYSLLFDLRLMLATVLRGLSPVRRANGR